MVRQLIRTVLLFAAIIGFSLVLGTYLSYANVRSNYQDILEARMQVVATHIGVVTETAQSLGIPLPEQHTLPALLDRERRTAPLLLSIDIAAAGGRVLFSSAPERVDTRLAPAADDALAFYLSRSIVNDFGLTTGEIRLRYDRQAVERQLDVLMRDLFVNAIPAFASGLVIGCGGILLLTLRLRHRADELATSGDES